MSIRSYKNIFEQFQRLFPELTKYAIGWKGVWFRDKHICIQMSDSSVIDFFYCAENEWSLIRTSNRENMAWKKTQKESKHE